MRRSPAGVEIVLSAVVCSSSFVRPKSRFAAVRYTISGKPYQFEVGNAYEINNQNLHSVMNMGAEDRISFIFDYVPADKLPNAAA